MVSTDIEKEWQKLCKKHDEARNEHHEAFLMVVRKMSQVLAGDGRGPTDKEIDTEEKARDKMMEIRKQIDEFIKKHLGN